MTKPSLNKLDKPIIKSIPRSAVEFTMLGLRPFLKGSRWVGSSNRYVLRTTQRLAKDYKSNNLRRRNLAQYIAASAVLHANDGWSYLGRSLACLIAGDAHRALHFAYYAELRASMSLLAGIGVGVFDKRHAAITAPNVSTRLSTKAGTHAIAWLALEHWSRAPASGALLSKLITIEGVTLEDWFAPLGGGSTLLPQAQLWFEQWGMDLRFAMKDREARNESSYHPDGLPTTTVIPSADAVDFAKDLWRSLEPRGSSTFEQIDRHILRLALERHYRGSMGRQPNASNAQFVSLVRSVVAAQALSPASGQLMQRFLLRELVPQEPAVLGYSGIRPGDMRSDPFSIASRAVMLLRVATGSARDLLERAGLGADTLAFWWRQIGQGRGLWSPGEEPADLTDLWADIRDFLLELDEAAAADPQMVTSFSGLARGMSAGLHLFSSHERVSLWGLCPP